MFALKASPSRRGVAHQSDVDFLNRLINQNGGYTHFKSEYVVEMLERVPATEDLTYRDMQRLFTAMNFVSSDYRTDVYSAMLPGLLILKVCRPKLFRDLVEGKDVTEAIMRLFDLEGASVEDSGSMYLSNHQAFLFKIALSAASYEGLSPDITNTFDRYRDSPHRYALLSEIATKHLTTIVF